LRRVERISVARGRSVPVGFCEDDCPSPLFIPKHSAAAFHAIQCRFGSVGKVLDGSRDLACRHCLAGKRQFTQDQLRYRPSTAPPPRFLGAGCPLTVAEATSRRLSVLFRYGITGRSFAAKDVQCRAKSFLPCLYQLGLFCFLFTQGECRIRSASNASR
jgi:hypothetical protein